VYLFCKNVFKDGSVWRFEECLEQELRCPRIDLLVDEFEHGRGCNFVRTQLGKMRC
jgi:hypothetical protein